MVNGSLKKQALLVKMPKEISDSQKKFAAFFSDFHKFIKDQKNVSASEKVVSFELVLRENYFHYRIVASEKLIPLMQSLIYTKFKNAEVYEEKLNDCKNKLKIEAVEFELKRFNYFPLKTSFSETDDPYLAMAAVLSKLDHFNERVVLQLVVHPTSESWLKQFMREKFYFVLGALNSVMIFLEKPFLERDFFNQWEEVRKKFNGKQFSANVRMVVYAPSIRELDEDFGLMLKAMSKYDNGDINELYKLKISKDKILANYLNRRLTKKKILLNNQELAAFFHFPDTDLKISNVDHVSSKKIEPPKELPKGNLLQKANISVFGVTNYRNTKLQFGLKRDDRNRHLYVIGKTGMGKSKLIELLTISDIYQNKGLCVIDPHGDLAVDLLRFIPKERVKDVIYFNPADEKYPVGFNPLECYSPEAKHHVVAGFIAIFKKQFAATWSNRLEHMLRFIVLALIEVGDATVVDIVRLLTDIEFRQSVIARLDDPVVKNFWTHEFASWNEKFDNEAVIPIINQVGQFIANDYIRNCVGQRKSAFDFYKAMNEGKIIIINIAKGKLGEDNTALLGSMLITKIQEATMARVNLPENDRREFYLYVDEFQHFATESFNQILSEARKFNLSLTIAHQYIDQLSDEIRKTVFGNVGSVVSFRIGPEDAHFLKREFAPQINEDDLINLNFREIYVKLSIGGKTSEPFSADTLSVPEPSSDLTNEIIETSRINYGKSRTQVKSEFKALGQEVVGLITRNESEEKMDDNEFEEPIV